MLKLVRTFQRCLETPSISDVCFSVLILTLQTKQLIFAREIVLMVISRTLQHLHVYKNVQKANTVIIRQMFAKILVQVLISATHKPESAFCIAHLGNSQMWIIIENATRNVLEVSTPTQKTQLANV